MIHIRKISQAHMLTLPHPLLSPPLPAPLLRSLNKGQGGFMAGDALLHLVSPTRCDFKLDNLTVAQPQNVLAEESLSEHTAEL